jgi:hypothetical protein
MRYLFTHPVRKWRWQGLALFALALAVLALTFMAYFSPDMMVALTNTVWALCGF